MRSIGGTMDMQTRWFPEDRSPKPWIATAASRTAVVVMALLAGAVPVAYLQGLISLWPVAAWIAATAACAFGALAAAAHGRNRALRVELARERRRYRALRDLVPVGICEMDAAGAVVDSNAAHATLLGGTGSAFGDIHPEDRARLGARWQAAHIARSAFQDEVRLVGPDGAMRCLGIDAVPLADAGASPEGYLCCLTDRTAERRITSAEATARAQAERAERAKSRFFAAASHDLRQPIHAAGLFLGMLSMRDLGTKERELVSMVDQSLTATQGLLNRLLDVARLDAGVVEPCLETVDLGNVLERLAAEMAGEAAAHGVRLTVKPSRLLLRTDAGLLERMLQNIASNAIRYSRRGRVLIGARRRGGVVRIEVWDTGEGIPQDQLSAIFEEFHQLGNAERDRRQGLGLGLAIVNRLSRMLDHPVDVRSVPGAGCRFGISVPLARLPIVQAAREAMAEPEQARRSDLNGVSVVVIEDEPDILQAMRMFLECAGCRVIAAESASAALEGIAAAGWLPSVIVADLRLRGGASGIDAIDIIRRRYDLAIPGIVVTGDTAPQQVRAADRSGNALLHKPVRPDVLLAAVERAVAPLALAV